MSFGKTIKTLRLGRNMTQEELAEILSVSPQAISRWETDSSMPDISLVPTICNLFDVTSDHLLGIDVASNKRKIDEIGNRASSLYSRGYITEAISILEEALKTHPNAFDLIYHLMYCYYWQGNAESESEKKKLYRDKAVALGEKILESCTDNATRHGAVQILCYSYANNGKRDRAIELANSMPCVAVSREFLMAAIEVGDEKNRARLHKNSTLFDSLLIGIIYPNCILDSGVSVYTPDETASLMDKAISFIKLMFEDGDYGFFNTRLQSAYEENAKYYAQKHDSKKTLDYLKNAADSAVRFIEFVGDTEFTNTSLLFRGNNSGSISISSSDNDAKELLDKLSDRCFDFVRDEVEFSDIQNLLKKYAGKWKADESHITAD